MQLTAEQRADIARQRRENPGTRHVTITPTPEQAEQHRRAVQEEEGARDANSAHAQKLFAALEEPGFSGDLRRAIVASRKEPDNLARELSVAPALLHEFLDGDASLPTAVVDRLVELLGLKQRTRRNRGGRPKDIQWVASDTLTCARRKASAFTCSHATVSAEPASYSAERL